MSQIKRIIRILRTNKPLLFAIYGALGCLLAALLLGEPFLAATKIDAVQSAQGIVLLIDTSASMSDGKLTEVKQAALKFVKRRDLTQDKIAVVNFGVDVNTVAPLTDDINTLSNAIGSLSEDGGTPMTEGIAKAYQELQSTQLNRNILLFTDGLPDDAQLAYQEAQIVRNNQVNLIAVATDGADVNYLATLTGNSSLVFYANRGGFDAAFRQAEAAIYRQLVESDNGGNYSPLYSLLRIGAWTAFLAMGISLFLVSGQNQYMRRQLITKDKLIITLLGSLTVGMIAGAAGQLILMFNPLTDVLETGAQILGWVILGTLVGGGIRFFVPNLKFKHALFGGNIGGAVGAISFLMTAGILGDMLGRLVGAAFLGFWIGLMIALAERQQLKEQPYLLVHWTPTEKTSYLLGAEPITIGSSPNAQIPLNASAGFTPITAQIYQRGGSIIMEFDSGYAAQKNMRKTVQNLNIGDTRKLGNFTLEITGLGMGKLDKT